MQGIQVASLFGVLDLKDNLTPGLQKAESGLHNLGGKVSGVGDKMTSFGRTFAPISLALGAMGAAGIKTASDFDGAMAEISARTGVVGEDLEAVRQFALKMGADTAFSAQEAAAGLLELLSSGQSVEEAMQTLPTVLDMAAASGEALGFSADALTDIMAAFGLEIEDATDVANSLARAAGASSADIASLAQGFGNVGPVAKQFGMDVNQTAATLALLAENGIKGAEAGTALKSMLMNMTRDTEEVAGAWNELGTSFYDAEGNARDLDKVIADIKIGLEGMPIERQNALLRDLGGAYGIVALTALAGDRAISEMEESMTGQADASTVAAARMDTFKGTMDTLKGSVETLMIEAFTPFMNDTLKPLLEMLTTAAGKVADWTTENPKLTKTVVALSLGFAGLTASMVVLGPIVGAAGAALGLVLSPIALLAGLFALGIANNIEDLADNFEQVRRSIEDGDLVGLLEGIAGALFDIPEGIAKWIGDMVGIDVPEGLKAWGDILDSIKAIIEWIAEKASDLLGSIHFEVPQALKDLLGIVNSIHTGIGNIAGFGGGNVNTMVLGEAELFGGLPVVPGTPYYDPTLGSVYKYQEGALAKGSTTTRITPKGHDYPGPARKGQPYAIGTGAQPELFIPDSNGMMYPAGSYGGTSIQIGAVYVQDEDPARWLDRLEREASRRNLTLGVARG